MSVSEAELRELYQRYAPVLHHRCRAILGSDEEAQDAVQETFASVIRHYDSFRQEASPLTWMYRISTNYCLNRLRNRRLRDRKHLDHRVELSGDNPQPTAGGALDADAVRRLIEDADDETRQIVIHLFFDDMTREEAAVMVGISVPTLRKRLEGFLKRARLVLALLLLTFTGLLP